MTLQTSYILAAIITAAGMAGAAIWSKRGSKAVELNTMAMAMVTTLETRVGRLERLEVWRDLCQNLDGDYIALLTDWIYRQKPPPPPPRPTYPAQPT